MSLRPFVFRWFAKAHATTTLLLSSAATATPESALVVVFRNVGGLQEAPPFVEMLARRNPVLAWSARSKCGQTRIHVDCAPTRVQASPGVPHERAFAGALRKYQLIPRLSERTSLMVELSSFITHAQSSARVSSLAYVGP